MKKANSNWPYTLLSSAAMGVIVSDAVKWYIEDIDSKDAGQRQLAEAKATQLGFMVARWVAKRGGLACGTWPAVIFLGLKDGKKLRRRSAKKWTALLRRLKEG
jgi:hypothetical protein